MIKNYGARAHDFKTEHLDTLLEQLTMFELGGVQLAPIKLFKHLKTHADFIDGDSKYDVLKAFRENHKQIHVLGCYLNHAHPDGQKRKAFKDITKGYIDVAKAFGDVCECVATESFTLNEDGTPHLDDHKTRGYDTFLKEIVECVAYAENQSVDFVVEPAKHHIIHDIVTTKKLIKDVASPRLKLIFDPCNLMSESLALRQEQFFYEFLEVFESKIVTVHVKDFTFKGGEKEFLSAGEGSLEYATLHRLLKQSNVPMNVLLEGFNADRLAEVVRFLKQGQ